MSIYRRNALFQQEAIHCDVEGAYFSAIKKFIPVI